MKNYTHITMLLDRSGSMKTVIAETIGGFNNFIEGQKKVDGKATFTLVQFDDKYEPNYVGEDIRKVENLSEATYRPRGWTCLLDAMGKAIVETGEFLAKIDEKDRPEKVVFVVSTDGQENSSKEFSQKNIADLVRKQSEEFKWEFVFLGTNQDAVLEARKYNIKGMNSMTYANNATGISAASQSLNSNLASFRGGSKSDMSFTKKDRDDQVAAGVK